MRQIGTGEFGRPPLHCSGCFCISDRASNNGGSAVCTRVADPEPELAHFVRSRSRSRGSLPEPEPFQICVVPHLRSGSCRSRRIAGIVCRSRSRSRSRPNFVRFGIPSIDVLLCQATWPRRAGYFCWSVHDVHRVCHPGQALWPCLSALLLASYRDSATLGEQPGLPLLLETGSRTCVTDKVAIQAKYTLTEAMLTSRRQSIRAVKAKYTMSR